jgi:hypothetical protein
MAKNKIIRGIKFAKEIGRYGALYFSCLVASAAGLSYFSAPHWNKPTNSSGINSIQLSVPASQEDVLDFTQLEISKSPIGSLEQVVENIPNSLNNPSSSFKKLSNSKSSKELSKIPGFEVYFSPKAVYTRETNPRKIDKIIVHTTGVESLESTLHWFISPLNVHNHGSHYIVDRDGKIYYFISESEKANHALGYNVSSLGVECVGVPTKPLTHSQFDSVINLINSLQFRYGLPDSQVFGHYEKDDRNHKVDPGKGNMEKIRSRLATDGLGVPLRYSKR